LKVTGDAPLAEAAWAKLFAARRSIFEAANAPNATERAIARQLEEVIRSLPPNIAVAGISKYFAPRIDIVELATVVEVFSRVGNEGPDIRIELQDKLRHALRTYLKDGVTLILSQDDFNDQTKAYLATALARVGDPEDVTELRRLIQADIERIKNGRSANVRRRVSTSWASWHVRALASLDPCAGEDVLLELLNEQEDRYEIEAASTLVRLARIRNLPEQFVHKVDYRAVWTARAGSQPVQFNEDRRRRYADAIKARILALLAERASDARPTRYDYRLKELTKQLAELDGRGSSELVMQVMALPGEWDSWIRVGAMESLLLSGAQLPTEATLEILNPAIDQICEEGIGDHNSAWLLVRCLGLLPFLDSPAVGVERIREVISATDLWPTALRDLFAALGNSRCNEALDLLIELAGADGKEVLVFLKSGLMRWRRSAGQRRHKYC
jgi:hypothetical protein